METKLKTKRYPKGQMTVVRNDLIRVCLFDCGEVIMTREIGDDTVSIHYRDGMAVWARVYTYSQHDGVGFNVTDPQTLGELVTQ